MFRDNRVVVFIFFLINTVVLAIRCPVPSYPENGKVFYSSLDYGAKLEYECNKGFVLKNYQPRICTGDGKWSNEVPQCIELHCRMPEAPERGSVKVYESPPKPGTLIFYFCDEGTILDGVSTSKCLSSGEWNSDTPKCLRSCYVPDIKDGEIGQFQWKNRLGQELIILRVGESVEHRQTVIIICKSGFSPGSNTAGRTQEVECIDGIWSAALRCHSNACQRCHKVDANDVKIKEAFGD